MYKIGDYVVYGQNGVCRVDDIGPLSIAGVSKERVYYYLTPLNMEGSRVYTPVDSDKVVIRPVSSKKEACELIREIKQIEPLTISNEKNRESIYRELTMSCNCKDLLKIIKTVMVRKQQRTAEGKRLMACDEKYFRIASEHLSGELAVSLDVSIAAAEELIDSNVG